MCKNTQHEGDDDDEDNNNNNNNSTNNNRAARHETPHYAVFAVLSVSAAFIGQN
jgi:hypothetical protein